jgi:creatinine amidohydrolase
MLVIKRSRLDEPMQSKVRWEEMFRDEMQAAIAERPVCYFAYGICEPHGLQNALGLDGLKAYHLVSEAAEAHGGIAAPPTWWHISEAPVSAAFWERAVGPEWRDIGATYLTSVPPRIFYEMIVYHLRSAELAGFRVAILVTGHYGGLEIDMRLITQTYSACRPLRAAAVADWELMRCKDYTGDHAGLCETSQLWALRPELVDLSRMPPEPAGEPCFASTEGARKASRRVGEAIVHSQINSLKLLSDRLLRDAEAQPQTTWFPFEDADAIWRQVLAKEHEWVVNHPVEGFGEYAAERSKLYPAPEW